MKTILTLTGALALGATAAFADGHASGDAEAGEGVFRKCSSCHVVANGDDVLAGRGKTGPNLFGIVGRPAGSLEDYKFGDSIVASGEAGLEWNEADFVSYVADPRAFLKEYNDDSGARSKMSFRLTDEQDAKDVWAYLASFE